MVARELMMDTDQKPSAVGKVLKLLGACAVVVVAAAIWAPMQDAVMRNVNEQLQKGAEDAPVSVSPPSRVNDGAAASAGQLGCGTDASKQLALKVVKENPPELILHAMRVDALIQLNKSCDQEAGHPNSCATKLDEIRQQAIYSLRSIRLEGRDQTTGAVVCNATLHADLPENLGSGEWEISYKIEKMEDGGLHIDMTGLP